LQEGIVLLQKAVDAGVRSEIVQTGLGDAQRKSRNFESAKRHYEMALAMDANFPGAHRGLALLAYSQGNETNGQNHWDQFIRGQNDSKGRVRELMGTP
jgi:Tfp pilus assembly protein PilF